MATSLQCIIHVEGKGDEEIKALSKDKWQKIELAAQIRSSKPNFMQSKYYAVVESLPNTLSDHDGYHTSCYRTFTAVPGIPAHSSESESHSQYPYLRSAGTQLPTSTSGVLPKVCVFCDKPRKKFKGKEQDLASCTLDSPEFNVKNAALILNDQKMLTKIGSVDL